MFQPFGYVPLFKLLHVLFNVTDAGFECFESFPEGRIELVKGEFALQFEGRQEVVVCLIPGERLEEQIIEVLVSYVQPTTFCGTLAAVNAFLLYRVAGKRRTTSGTLCASFECCLPPSPTSYSLFVLTNKVILEERITTETWSTRSCTEGIGRSLLLAHFPPFLRVTPCLRGIFYSPYNPYCQFT
jgi:hypothetical protein